MRKAGLSLTYDKIEAYQHEFPSNLYKIVEHLEHISFCDSNFFLCNLSELKDMAQTVSLHGKNLPLFDQYTICRSPINPSDPREKDILKRVRCRILLIFPVCDDSLSHTPVFSLPVPLFSQQRRTCPF